MWIWIAETVLMCVKKKKICRILKVWILVNLLITVYLKCVSLGIKINHAFIEMTLKNIDVSYDDLA